MDISDSKRLLEAVIVCVEYPVSGNIEVHVPIVWTTECSQYCIGVLGCQLSDSI